MTTFESTMEAIRDGMTAYRGIYSTFGGLTEVIDMMERSIKQKIQTDTEPELTQKDKDLFICFMNTTYEILVTTKFEGTEIKLMSELIALVSNFNSIHGLVNEFIVKVLEICLAQRRTMDEALIMMSVLLNKISSKLDDPDCRRLSEKYYYEFNNFLKESKDYSGV